MFAREDADGVRKKRDRPDDDGGADGAGEGLKKKKKKKSKEDKKRDKREKKRKEKGPRRAGSWSSRRRAKGRALEGRLPLDPSGVPTTTEGEGGKKVKREKEMEGKAGKVSKRKGKSSEPDKVGKKKAQEEVRQG